MNNGKLMIEKVGNKLEEKDIILIGLGEEMNLNINEFLKENALFQQKKDFFWDMSSIELEWIKYSILSHEIDEKNEYLMLYVNRYNQLKKIVNNKLYFIVSLCTDGLIKMSNFDNEKIVCPCGDFLHGQCEDGIDEDIIDLKPVYEKIYDCLLQYENKDELSQKLVEIIPKCNKCGKDIVFNIKGNNTSYKYLEKPYLEQWAKYTKWLECTLNKKIALLEFGAGFEFPSVIRWPFEKIAFFNEKAFLIRVHSVLYNLTEQLKGKAYGIKMNPNAFIDHYIKNRRIPKMIAIIDYDAGNIKSVEKALKFIGENVVVTRDKNTILNADKVILPGVGAFGDAMKKLEEYDLISVIKEVVNKNIPFLGICLGLQLLFESSDEAPGIKGLSILKGKIVRIPDKEDLKIPHIGWNSLDLKNKGRLFKDIPNQSYVYFVHSYYLQADEEEIVKATTEYGVEIHASVEKDNVFACQFHPEKSGDVGMKILTNFANL